MIQRSQLTHRKVAALFLALGLLSGCGSNVPSRTTPATSRTSTAPKPVQQQQEPRPVGPQINDPGDVPTNMPQPIPTPDPPIVPGKVSVKATSYSISSYPLNPFGLGTRVINIHIDLKWQLLPNASHYRISRAVEGSEEFVTKTTVSASRLGKLLPLFWREYSIPAVNPISPGVKYRYQIEAFNSSDQVIAVGQDETAPLYPLDIPKLVGPDNNVVGVGIQPAFQWERVNNADGYFVEVFAGKTFLPQWRGFRAGQEGITIKYGESGDSYPGVMPGFWTTVLVPGVPYTWSVTAYRTDTGNAQTAKAFARSNAPSWVFTP
ncbi:MAG: hypothetical protein FJY99_10575 [Candidatus Sericytochromatia bacterium]|nr:hypothetical protein [Candidatus Tanganyikabacteria bacterium]